MRPSATLAVVLALVAAAQPTGQAAGPPWFARVRAAAVARARAPLASEALTAAQVEVARARTTGLPQLRFDQRSRLAVDARFDLDLEAGVRVPLWAPASEADRELTAERLAATRRQLLGERRAELHDILASAVSLLASEARLRTLDGLAATLNAAGPTAAVAPPLRLVDVRLLAAGRSSQLRRGEALRRSLEATLGVPLPAPERAAAGLPVDAGAAAAARDPLGFAAAALEPARCVAASDSVTLARLAEDDAHLTARLDRARALPRADLDLGGAVHLGVQQPSASYAVRLGVSVRLPAWSPATGAASIAVGAGGIEQSLNARWPNAAPAAPPVDGPSEDAGRSAERIAAVRRVRQQVTLLVGGEADLLERRRILLRALSEPHDGGLTAAYRRATLALQLADADEALGLTRLDAALVCGALPP